MAEHTLDERVSTLEQHLREQAELIDRLLVIEQPLELRLDASLDAKFDAKLDPLRRDLNIIKHAVKAVLTRLA